MRVQIYQEEFISGEQGVTLIQQTSRNGEKFFGLRVWLETPQTLLDHSTPEDDDRNAVTFWAAGENDLIKLVDRMASALGRAIRSPLDAR